MSRPPGYYLWQELRQRVIDTYGTTCLCCGKTPELKEDIHIDHIIPQSKAPELKHNFNNLQVLCNKCNIKKSNHHSTDYRPEKFKKKYPLPKEKKPKPLYEENILSLEEIEEKFILMEKKIRLEGFKRLLLTQTVDWKIRSYEYFSFAQIENNKAKIWNAADRMMKRLLNLK